MEEKVRSLISCSPTKFNSKVRPLNGKICWRLVYFCLEVNLSQGVLVLNFKLTRKIGFFWMTLLSCQALSVKRLLQNQILGL